LVQTLDSGWDGDGDGEISTGMGMGMGNFLWGRGGDGEYFMGTGWGWGKFYEDGAGMGTILFTVSLSTLNHVPGDELQHRNTNVTID